MDRGCVGKFGLEEHRSLYGVGEADQLGDIVDPFHGFLQIITFEHEMGLVVLLVDVLDDEFTVSLLHDGAFVQVE